MTNIILEKLTAIERACNIRILYSCESGSRGWGFPSPDSDYDVRFIYTRPYRSYLSIEEKPDHLSFPINDELDIYGWDLRKVLQLVRKSNTTPFEWLQSPVIYRQEAGFRDELWALCPAFFSRRSNAHHYLGIAKGALDTMDANGAITIKKLFYILRPLLAAKWCLERNSIAPMHVEPLLELLPPGLMHMVRELIKQKAAAAEKQSIIPEGDLLSYITDELTRCFETSGSLPRDSFGTELLDDFFKNTIQRYDHTGTKTKEPAAV
ncbi:nucleotidyltransferase domain-containing protein [Chitinophagaceae bacterium MMS25-I14]